MNSLTGLRLESRNELANNSSPTIVSIAHAPRARSGPIAKIVSHSASMVTTSGTNLVISVLESLGKANPPGVGGIYQAMHFLVLEVNMARTRGSGPRCDKRVSYPSAEVSPTNIRIASCTGNEDIN